MTNNVAMSCPIQSPWGELWFEAVSGSGGYHLQLSRDGELLAADWIGSGADLIARWQNVRSRLAILVAEASDATAWGKHGAGGPWWGGTSHMPATVAMALRPPILPVGQPAAGR